jgi:hypothetical protein
MCQPIESHNPLTFSFWTQDAVSAGLSLLLDSTSVRRQVNSATTDFMTPGHSRECSSFSAIQGIPSMLLDPKTYFRIHKGLSLLSVLSQMNLYTPSYFSSIHLNIIFPSTFMSSYLHLSFWFCTEPLSALFSPMRATCLNHVISLDSSHK